MYTIRLFLLLLIVPLADVHAAVFTVTSNASSGTNTFRSAINSANDNPGADTIQFNLADTTLAGRSIDVLTPLPDISDPVIIDGTTQPGSPFGNSFARIQISTLLSLAEGINIVSDSCELYGLFIHGFQTGILVTGAYVQIGAITNGNVIYDCSIACVEISSTDHVVLISNLIGVDTIQNVPAGGNPGHGLVVSGSFAVKIGGNGSAAGNVISGNDYGIRFDNSSYCDVNGNFIGITSLVNLARPNEYGIRGTGLNVAIEIGGDSLFERNIISANINEGIYGNFSSCTIQGNFIGLGTDSSALGNGGHGIQLSVGSSFNLIGGGLPPLGNLIGYNGEEGVYIQSPTSELNTITNNLFYCNSSMNGSGGIDLNSGNNNLLPPQILIANSAGLSGITEPFGMVEIFQDDTCQYCEGGTRIATVSAGASGVFTYADSIAGSVTATVTDLSGNSSEFAACVPATGTLCIVAAFYTNAPLCPLSDIVFMDQTVTAPGTALTSWSWTFGDGGTSDLPSPVHQFTTPGDYEVQFIVANSSGCSDTFSSVMTINPLPVAVFESPVQSCEGVAVNFDDKSQASGDAELVEWNWTFGDGDSSSAVDPVHSYASQGTYDIALKVTDDFGCSDVSSASINILPPVAASFDFTTDFLIVSFFNTSFVNGASSYSWNFGDGVISNAEDPVHTYLNSGNYQVCLSVFDSACLAPDSACKFIDLITGISSLKDDQLILYPVPATGQLFLSGLPLQPGTIRIVDAAGRTFFETPANSAQEAQKVSVSDLPCGAYWLVWKSNTESHIDLFRLFIKQ